MYNCLVSSDVHGQRRTVIFFYHKTNQFSGFREPWNRLWYELKKVFLNHCNNFSVLQLRQKVEHRFLSKQRHFHQSVSDSLETALQTSVYSDYKKLSIYWYSFFSSREICIPTKGCFDTSLHTACLSAISYFTSSANFY